MALSPSETKEPEMTSLPELVDIAFEQFVQALPEGYDRLAYETGTFSRGRKIRNPLEPDRLTNPDFMVHINTFHRTITR